MWGVGGDTMNDFMTAQEVAAVLRCSLSRAYKLMAAIRKEMEKQGLLTIRGRVPRKRLMERVGLV